MNTAPRQRRHFRNMFASGSAAPQKKKQKKKQPKLPTPPTVCVYFRLLVFTTSQHLPPVGQCGSHAHSSSSSKVTRVVDTGPVVVV